MPLVIVPLLVLGGTAYRYLLESEETKLISRMRSQVSQLRQEVDLTFSQVQANIELLSSDKVMIRYALVEDEYARYKIYQRGLLERFADYQRAFPIYDEIRFILTDGYEDSHWSRSDYLNRNDEENGSRWFSQLDGSNDAIYHEILINPDTDEHVLYAFKALRLVNLSVEEAREKKTLRGFLGITVRLDWLQGSLQALLVERQQAVDFYSEQGELLFSVGDLDAATFDLRGSSESRSGLLEPTEEGYYQLQVQTQLGYRIRYRVNVAAAHAKAQALALEILAITFASIAFTLLLLFVFLRRSVIVPLRELAYASRDIGEGHLKTLVSLGGCDELSDLSKGFNDMAQSLVDSDERIRFIAYHDSLTRLPNRRMFHYLLSNTIAAAGRSGERIALLFLDIDNFKTINDSLGHDVGDELLQLFARRVSESMRDEDMLVRPDTLQLRGEDLLSGDLVARLGGDEFTVVLPRLQQAADASLVAQRIIESMSRDFVLKGQHLRITTSIGITLYPDNGTSPDDLIKFADIAMYHAKSQGKNNFQFYSEDLNEAIADRIERENELRAAIEKQQLKLYFQPQIKLPSRQVYGLEALVRWEHPSKGMISPVHFIPLAEETGMIVELGAWVMHETCRIAKAWRQQGLLNTRVSVNVSSRQFERQDVALLVEQALEASGLPARYLTVELTESAIMSNHEDNLAVLEKIKRLGVKVSLDDFGTGYSSLSYLRSFPVDTLKIDRQFIVEAQEEEEVRAIISAIVIMAHALNLDVVAEGVEDAQQVEYLASIGCDVIQGFFFSRPLPQAEVAAFLVRVSRRGICA